MPVIGMMPVVIPMFSKSWNTSIDERAGTDEHPEQVARQRADAPYSPGEHRVEEQDDRGADEAQLLTGDGEDEVGVLLGHVREVRLRALEVAPGR